MRETVVSYDAPELRDGTVDWRGHVRGDEDFTVRMEFTSPDARRFVPTGRPWLLVFLQAAMRWGHPVVVDGPVDRGTLDHLMEWQEAQVAWHPHELRVVPIRADLERPPRRPQKVTSAIAAFSGGVDSCFTLVRHAGASTDPLYRRARLGAGLMVHGFDVRETNDTDFPSAYARSSRMLTAYGVTPYRLRTDLRQVGRAMGYAWGVSSHGISLAAALSCFEQFFSHSIIPSSYPYDHPVLPWGSTPVTDHLLGSATRPVWHDGAAFDKLDKVRLFAHEAPVAADLRVCHKGSVQDRNCGTCFKCLTTHACFWISGVEHPACFASPASVTDLALLDLNDTYKVRLGERMTRAARASGRDDVATELAAAVVRARG